MVCIHAGSLVPGAAWGWCLRAVPFSAVAASVAHVWLVFVYLLPTGSWWGSGAGAPGLRTVLPLWLQRASCFMLFFFGLLSPRNQSPSQATWSCGIPP